MKDLKSILKGLRTFKDKDTDEISEKSAWIKLRKGFSYKLKFIPFYDKKADDLKNLLNYWTHYIDGKRFLCDGKFNGCKCCEDGYKATPVNLVNVQLIQTTDNGYKNKIGEHFVLNLNYTILNQIQDYEKKNNESIFDIFESATINVKVDEEMSVSDAKESYSKSVYETTFSTSKTAIKPNIEQDTEEELWEFLKTIPKDLNEFVIGEKYVKEVSDKNENAVVANNSSEDKELVKEEKKEELVEEDDYVSGGYIITEKDIEEEGDSINDLIKEFNLDLED